MKKVIVLLKMKKHAGILICLSLFSLNTFIYIFPLPYDYGNVKIQDTIYEQNNLMPRFTLRTLEMSNTVYIKERENRYETSLRTTTEVTDVNVTTKKKQPWCEEARIHYPMALDYGQVLSSTLSLKPIHIHPYEFIFNPASVCNVSGEIYILSVVKSKVDHFVLRMAIRATWGRKANSKNNRLVFLLGNSKNSTIRYDVRQEYKIHNDMLMENFIDNYYNNTIKTTMGVRWIAKFCANARFVVFVDEDVMVNFLNLQTFFRDLIRYQELRLFEGEIHTDAGPHRNNTSKWYVSEEEYPFDCYPPFLSGGTILTSGRVVQKLNKAIPFVKFLKLDDVYLSIVANKVGIPPRNNVRVCMGVNKNFRDNFLTKHGFANHYRHIGKMLHKTYNM